MPEQYLLVAELIDGGYIPDCYFINGEHKEAIDNFRSHHPDAKVRQYAAWRWTSGYHRMCLYREDGTVLE
jgi:hypothetical protein